jgi:hypothetical protein
MPKKLRGAEGDAPDNDNGASSRGDSPAIVVTPGNEEPEVKEVTEGVKEVGLDGEDDKVAKGSPLEGKSATPPPETEAGKEQSGEKQGVQEAPASPMKGVKSPTIDASAAAKETLAVPSEPPATTVTSKPKSKRSTTASSKKAQTPVETAPRKKKPLPSRKTATSKAALMPSNPDTINEKNIIVARADPVKEDVV